MNQRSNRTNAHVGLHPDGIEAYGLNSNNRLNNRWTLILALLLPIAILAANAWLSQQQRTHGDTVVLPIHGFDPRDLLSGHYLTYEIDYGINDETGCPASDIEAVVCLMPEARVFSSDELPDSCTQFISGNCDNKARFITKLERFYIPEQYAKPLDQHVQNNRGELLISLDGAGNAAIRDLLIDGQPWKKLVAEQED